MIYKRNGRDCYLCLSRKKLIYVSPEETVRQKIINELIEKHGVPSNQIKVEESLAHYKEGHKGRADIIVFCDTLPLILIECKEPNSFLTHKTLEQVQKYNEILNAKIYGITNGTDSYWYLNDGTPISLLPSYEKVLKENKFKLSKAEKIESYNPFQNQDKLVKELKEFGIMGEDTPSHLASFIANIDGLFIEADKKIVLENNQNYKFVFDGGLRAASYGNASGGKWSGFYRYLMLKDANGDSQIVSFAVMGCANGTTTLIVAYDENEISHNSLQLSIDNFAKTDKKNVKIWHDGRITVGNRGPSPREQMLKLVEKKCPHLLENETIVLGVLDNSKIFDPQNADVQKFMKNIIDYVFCREEFRRQIKN